MSVIIVHHDMKTTLSQFENDMRKYISSIDGKLLLQNDVDYDRDNDRRM